MQLSNEENWPLGICQLP
ncbi:unnamed protein product [Lathyrus sativus]|nr:unnamed protein product [Lathyrus sativus]